MKRLRLIIVAVVAVGLLAAVGGLRRVPAGFESVRVSSGGEVEVVRAGWHFVGPGAKLLDYPVGVHAYRVPADDAAPVVFQDGLSKPVAFRVEIDVAAGSAASLFGRFSEDFEAGLGRLVIAAAGIEAASAPAPSNPEAFAAAVAARVGDELEPFGVDVRGTPVVRWGDRSLDAATAGDRRRRPSRPRTRRRVARINMERLAMARQGP